MGNKNDFDTETTLALLLKHNVPRYIKYFHEIGGVDAYEWDWLTYGCGDEAKDIDNPDYPAGMILRADQLLLFPDDEQVFKKSLSILVRAIAIMSFVPGGVRFNGVVYDSQVENYFYLEE